jgi:spore germination protein YaaH
MRQLGILAFLIASGTSSMLSAQSESGVHLARVSQLDGDRASMSPLVFKEIWAYLMAGEEQFLPTESPITDLAYFSARISSRGELFGSPDIRKLDSMTVRKHLVVAEVSNQAIVHFVLNPAYPLRDKLVRDIALAAIPYDGVNIDFEMMRTDDGPAFLEFLRLLKKAIGSRVLSVCVPARTRKMTDAYDYEAIAAIADRVFVMAYDEHWSGSVAGPVSSVGWASRVSAWAAKTVGPEKLVMGMPFYGRAWGNRNPAGAYKHSSVSRILAETSATWDRNPEGIPYFSFQETIDYTLFFDDAESIRQRGLAYQREGIHNIGFWRLGQEDPGVWKILGTEPLKGTELPTP